MYQWPIDEIVAKLDSPVKKMDPSQFEKILVDHGYGKSVVEFLSPLYQQANGGTFYDGAFRIISIEGSEADRMPGLVEWNDPEDWKSYAPPAGKEIFYFCMNAFGDQFGVALDENRELARDRTGVLWLERYVYEEASLEWKNILLKFLTNESDMGTYLARLKEYEWAVGFLGKPTPWQSFSWNQPPIIGGTQDIDNMKIVPTPVNVSFTLQVIQQAFAEDEEWGEDEE
jgi:hypothetical protein